MSMIELRKERMSTSALLIDKYHHQNLLMSPYMATNGDVSWNYSASHFQYKENELAINKIGLVAINDKSMFSK